MVLFPRSFDSTKWSHWCSNERNWLIALNSFILISGVILAGPAILSMATFTSSLDSNEDAEGGDNTVYNTSLALAIMGCFQVLVAVVGIIAADKVSLTLMVAYFWLAALVISSMFIWSVSALEFHSSFESWIRHHWDDDSMADVREVFCSKGTANDHCAVPMAGFPHGSQDLWCQAEHGSSNCTAIKEEAFLKPQQAVQDAKNVLVVWMTAAGGISLSSLVEMLASLVLTVRVVTVPIIMRSMQSTINYLMIFPVVSTICIGYVQYRPMYKFNIRVELQYAQGALLLLTAVVGVIAGHLRHRRLLQVYIGGKVLVLLIFIVLLSGSVIGLGRLKGGFSEDETDRIACEVGVYKCCCCNEEDVLNIDQPSLYSVPSCPEWADPVDLADIGAVYIKLGAMTTLLGVVFVLCGLWASIVVHNNLKGYQADYI